MHNKYCTNLYSRFQRIALGRGDAISIFDTSKVSFNELRILADLIACNLMGFGIRRGDVIAIYHGKGYLDYALQLACLKLGAPYVVLDPGNPENRLRKILDTCKPALVVVSCEINDSVAIACRDWGARVASLQMISSRCESEPNSSKWSDSVIGTDIAYLMFTSGSTGIPKGVAITHVQVMNFIDWATDEIGVNYTDIFTAVNPPYFDNSVFDFYVSLFNGAGLAPLSQSVIKSPESILSQVEEARCTVWFSVPSMLIYLSTMRALGPETWPAMRSIIFGGEGYPMAELRKLYSNFGERCNLINVYGPTECTCICSAYTVEPSDLYSRVGLPPIGKLAPNFRGFLLQDDVSVADGEIGELCLTGPNVSIGYFNDPDRTATAFVQNPFCSTHREIIYRTGDLMRLDSSDGKLYFIGRKDNQIKHMGYRIELEEIEAAFSSLDGVVQSAVIYKRIRLQYGHIIAYVASNSGELTIGYLESELRKKLPEYMIPNRIEIRDVLPKNANGKVDRKKLAEEA